MSSATPSITLTHPWAIPVNIPTPPGADRPAIPWSELRFCPVGLHHLRRWQGVPKHPLFYARCQKQFDAADLAWFAHGLHKDGNHDHNVNSFHPMLTGLFNDTSGAQGKDDRKAMADRVQELLFDVATLWDRTTGGTTMVIHVNGTKRPGAPSKPEHLKADVYLPPAFLRHHPETRSTIFGIVQSFIQMIGVKTVDDWIARARNTFNWSLNTPANPPRNAVMTSMPEPRSNSSHFVVLGQAISHLPSSRAALVDANEPNADVIMIAGLLKELDQAKEEIAFLHLSLTNRGSDAKQPSTPRRRIPASGTPFQTPSSSSATSVATPTQSRLAAPETAFSPALLALQKPLQKPAQQDGSASMGETAVHGFLEGHNLLHLEEQVQHTVSYVKPTDFVERLEAIGVPPTLVAVLIAVIELDQE